MSSIPVEMLDDLEDRLQAAVKSLDKLSRVAPKVSQRERLTAKADGVRLAQSYIREMRNDWLWSIRD